MGVGVTTVSSNVYLVEQREPARRAARTGEPPGREPIFGRAALDAAAFEMLCFGGRESFERRGRPAIVSQASRAMGLRSERAKDYARLHAGLGVPAVLRRRRRNRNL